MIREAKEIKGIPNGKEKVSQLADDFIIYVENRKDTNKKLLELIHEL